MQATSEKPIFPQRHLLGIEGLSPPGDRRAARSRRCGVRDFAPGREEAHDLARPNPDQSVLRGLDPHAILVRTRGQAARRRCDEHGGRHFEREERRDADRHRGHAQRDAAGHHRGAPPSGGRRPSARAQGRLRGHQRRRRRPRAPDPGAARRADDPPQQGPHRGARRSRSAATSCIRASRAPTSCCSARWAPMCGWSAPRRCCRPASRRMGVEVFRDMRSRARRRRHRDDAAPAARADERRLRALDQGIFPLFRPRRGKARAGRSPTLWSCIPAR